MYGISALPWPRASLLLVAFAVAACAGPGDSNEPAVVVITVSRTSAGDALAGPNGKTLYIRTKDQNGTSTCTSGPCAEAWNALAGNAATLQIGTGVSGTFGTTIWADGTQQITHNGQPLYYYSKDLAAGEARGHGSGDGVWCIAPITSDPGCRVVAVREPWDPTAFHAPRQAILAAETTADY